MNPRWIATALLCVLVDPAGSARAEDPTTFEAGRKAVERTRARVGPSPHAKNVILFLGDGMGVGTVTAARILEGQLRGQPGEENGLAFEDFPHVALIKTYNTNQQTPDSAGTMTAIVTGTKTRAGVVSVERDVALGDFAAAKGKELRTIVEQAEERGLATGIVTTTTLTHATPATLYAHCPDRSWQSDDKLPMEARIKDFPDIARQFVEFPFGDGIDVALAGGRRHFRSQEHADPEYPKFAGSRFDGRDLVAEWTTGRKRAAYVWNRKQLKDVNLEEVDRLLGLFNPSHMQYELDRAHDPGGEPSLSEMTATAIEVLQRNPAGYFLMVEGGRIDHAHHSSNAHRALVDTIAFSNAVRTALEATNRNETLILVTADHSHVFTLAGYPTRGNDILGKVVGNDPSGEPAQENSLDAMGRPYTTLGYHNGPGALSAVVTPYGDSIHQPPKDLGSRSEGTGRPDLTNVDTTHPDFLQEAAVPFKYETHSSEDVALYATGPGSQLIGGVLEQHYIYHAMVDSLGWNRGDEPDPPRE